MTQAAVMNFAGKSLKDDVHINAADLMPFTKDPDEAADPVDVASRVSFGFASLIGLQQAEFEQMKDAAERRMLAASLAHRSRL